MNYGELENFVCAVNFRRLNLVSNALATLKNVDFFNLGGYSILQCEEERYSPVSIASFSIAGDSNLSYWGVMNRPLENTKDYLGQFCNFGKRTFNYDPMGIFDYRLEVRISNNHFEQNLDKNIAEVFRDILVGKSLVGEENFDRICATDYGFSIKGKTMEENPLEKEDYEERLLSSFNGNLLRLLNLNRLYVHMIGNSLKVTNDFIERLVDAQKVTSSPP